jgi:hypothetical protein
MKVKNKKIDGRLPFEVPVSSAKFYLDFGKRRFYKCK